MTSNKELEAGLRAMAADFQFPGGGRKKLARLVTEHLWWFDAAEQRGMSWRDMVRAMAAAGITAKGGKAISIGTLSSAVWRRRADGNAEPVAEAPRSRVRLAPSRTISSPLPKPAKHAKTRRPRQKSPSGKIAEGPRIARPSALPSERRPRGGSASNEDILKYMDRARNVRRGSE